MPLMPRRCRHAVIRDFTPLRLLPAPFQAVAAAVALPPCLMPLRHVIVRRCRMLIRCRIFSYAYTNIAAPRRYAVFDARIAFAAAIVAKACLMMLLLPR